MQCGTWDRDVIRIMAIVNPALTGVLSRNVAFGVANPQVIEGEPDIT